MRIRLTSDAWCTVRNTRHFESLINEEDGSQGRRAFAALNISGWSCRGADLDALQRGEVVVGT